MDLFGPRLFLPHKNNFTQFRSNLYPYQCYKFTLFFPPDFFAHAYLEECQNMVWKTGTPRNIFKRLETSQFSINLLRCN